MVPIAKSETDGPSAPMGVAGTSDFFRPSRRDLGGFAIGPGSELPGYSQTVPPGREKGKTHCE